MQPGWGQKPSGCYPITSGVPRGNNERLRCFAFLLLSKSVPDDDQHIFPFLESFCDIIMTMFIMVTFGSQMRGVLFAMSCMTT